MWNIVAYRKPSSQAQMYELMPEDWKIEFPPA
jgi:hypothetical protein